MSFWSLAAIEHGLTIIAIISYHSIPLLHTLPSLFQALQDRLITTKLQSLYYRKSLRYMFEVYIKHQHNRVSNSFLRLHGNTVTTGCHSLKLKKQKSCQEVMSPFLKVREQTIVISWNSLPVRWKLDTALPSVNAFKAHTFIDNKARLNLMCCFSDHSPTHFRGSKIKNKRKKQTKNCMKM